MFFACYIGSQFATRAKLLVLTYVSLLKVCSFELLKSRGAHHAMYATSIRGVGRPGSRESGLLESISLWRELDRTWGAFRMKRIGLPVAALETIVLLAYSAPRGARSSNARAFRGSCTGKRNTSNKVSSFWAWRWIKRAIPSACPSSATQRCSDGCSRINAGTSCCLTTSS